MSLVPVADELMLIFRALVLVGKGVLAVRLYQTGLHRRYRVFFAYLLASNLQTLILLPLDVRGAAYAILWMLTQPLMWIFYILLVLEVYSLVLEDHKGLYTLGRWLLYGALALALGLSAFSLALPSSAADLQRGVLLFNWFLIQRGIYLSLVIFLLIILVFLARYPVPLTRNVIAHSVVYSAFFLSLSLAMLIRTFLGYDVGRGVNLAMVAISTSCVAAWLGLLRPAGEQQPARAAVRLEPEHERRLVEQLNAMNQTLLRAARK